MNTQLFNKMKYDSKNHVYAFERFYDILKTFDRKTKRGQREIDRKKENRIREKDQENDDKTQSKHQREIKSFRLRR